MGFKVEVVEGARPSKVVFYKVSLGITEEAKGLHEELKGAAERVGVTMSELVRQMLRHCLEEMGEL